MSSIINDMSQSGARFNFEKNIQPNKDFVLLENIIEDRGSLYSVSYGRVQGRESIKMFLRRLKNNKKYAAATHNSWAVRIAKNDAIYETKADDGELGAGMVILRVMQKSEVTNCIICVTRWFGGIKLEQDRFKHLQNASRFAVLEVENGT